MRQQSINIKSIFIYNDKSCTNCPSKIRSNYGYIYFCLVLNCMLLGQYNVDDVTEGETVTKNVSNDFRMIHEQFQIDTNK